jgi:hypothetical protein
VNFRIILWRLVVEKWLIDQSFFKMWRNFLSSVLCRTSIPFPSFKQPNARNCWFETWTGRCVIWRSILDDISHFEGHIWMIAEETRNWRPDWKKKLDTGFYRSIILTSRGLFYRRKPVKKSVSWEVSADIEGFRFNLIKSKARNL